MPIFKIGDKLYDYFFTEKEERKMKLMKLNQIL